MVEISDRDGTNLAASDFAGVWFLLIVNDAELARRAGDTATLTGADAEYTIQGQDFEVGDTVAFEVWEGEPA